MQVEINVRRLTDGSNETAADVVAKTGEVLYTATGEWQGGHRARADAEQWANENGHQIYGAEDDFNYVGSRHHY